MRYLRSSLCAALLAALGSCATPFAPTEFPVLEDPGLEGIWDVRFEEAFGASPGDDEAATPLRFSVTRVGGAASAGSLSALLSVDEGDRPTSYRVAVLDERAEGGAAEAFLEGQLISAGASTFLSLQPDAAGSSDPFHFFAAPLQRTFRFERVGDTARLWRHRRTLLWTPVPMAGELCFDSGGEGPSGIVQRFDDALDVYASSREEDWSLFAVAVRVE